MQVFEKVAAGLVHMHRRGVYHADLKPNNIMLSRTGDVKIIDYGLAWIKGEAKGRVQGTPEYMAPEQARTRSSTKRTDIYNFGATMYRLLTWRLPPSVLASTGGVAVDTEDVPQHAQAGRRFAARMAPPDLCDLVHHCLGSAQKRPERVADIQAKLDRLVEQLVRSPEDKLEAMEW